MNDLLDRLRELLLDTGYTIDGVRERLGDVAATALSREEPVPALRATEGDDPLGTLVRLWWLGAAVDVRRAPRGLPVEELAAAGLVTVEGGRITSTVHLQPWETGGYVVSDRKVRPGDPALRADHVVGAGGASANLAQLVSRRPVGRALDLGTGCGVQVLHLDGRAEEIVATDVNPRALDLARLSWGLSGIREVDARQGSLFDPVPGERFDLIVSNPPFVISPAGRFSYRESGFQADDFCRDLVRLAPRHLAPGGTCQLLANWLHVGGEDWQDRVGGWLAETGCDGWAVQRDVQDPAEYVELWLRDAAEQGTPRYRELYEDWLGWFESENVTGIGFGWITLNDSGSLDPVVRVEELGHRVELPVGGYVDEVLGSITGAHRLTDAELLGARLAPADGMLEERIGPPGAEDPARIVLRQTRGLRRSAQVGTVEAALAGVCDGQYPLDPLLAAIAELTGEDPDDLRAKAPEGLRSLIAEGFFHISTG
ncbi:Methyltransferase small domain-containing protein [Streptosporangium subroseum]|uniref:Methyltransferase small domain-containing protein n=1 Tax=Streptosporangium subroseum TaxID=106412 RepID=A0A239IQ45_9ACTN|nr:methyltransferase [Streptosporangium subroseum]SNS95679.1 Methyltransferase small domain-containing protein [Streptosporangium subroseum]